MDLTGRLPREGTDALPRGVRPVDRLVAAYNGLFAALWLGLAPAGGAAALAAASTHAVGALALPALLRRLSPEPSRPVRWLREAYPLLWLGVFWGELDAVIPRLHAASFDAAARSVDLAIFGVHLNEVWMPAMPHLWLSESLHLMYFLYYPMIFLPPLWLLATGREEALRDVVFRLMVTYVACYVLYLLFPVYGPHVGSVRYAGPLTDGFFYRLVEAAHAGGDVRGAALPSSHVAGAVTTAVLGWRWFSRRAAWLFTLQAAGVTVATVYTQSHYAVDAVAGLALALLLQASVPRLREALLPGRSAPAVPLLPAVPSEGIR